MVDLEGKGFGTRAVHGAGPPDPVTGAVVPADLAGHDVPAGGGRASRWPTSTPAAATPPAPRSRPTSPCSRARRTGSRSPRAWPRRTRCCACVGAGDHVLLPDDAYGGTIRLAVQVHAPAGLAVDTVDLTDLDAVAAAWQPGTRMVWVETPSNPWLRIVDIEAISELAHERGAIVVVDNTFATPALQQPARARRRRRRPLLHQVPRRPQRRGRRLRRHATTTSWPSASGSSRTPPARCPGPLDCYLVHRGARTLQLRMERHSESAAAVAELPGRPPGRRRGAVPGPARPPRPRRRRPPDVGLRRDGVDPARRRRGRRPRGVPAHRAVHARREPRRGREPHRAPRPHDPRVGGRHDQRGPGRPRAPRRRHRGRRRPPRRPPARPLG